MSDIMTPIPFGELMNWVLSERKMEGSVFGVNRAYMADTASQLELFGEWIETPFGPAAGPHTQLAQNIVAAYYAGARFFELKTVQIMDGEEMSKCVPKPCILAEDECYNCEWSTELTVEQAMAEYIKAWYANKLIAREFHLGSGDGFVFNMSVGYDYAGITSEKIDRFIEGLKDASQTAIFEECRAWALANIASFKYVDVTYIENICPHVCTSITLSTLHGCPPQEIERIASYLIETKRLHTFVKCNPTILGYASARKILDGMGYDYVAFDDHHFREDLQFCDAVPMFTRLQAQAQARSLGFGLKLSNTFPVDVTRGELPSAEMYMSGRSLYPLTIEMANRFTEAFDGRMRLSFSGGVDAFNIRGLFEAGIWPITVATTALKPGGYARFVQLAERFYGMPLAPFAGVSVGAVEALAEAAHADVHHVKPIKPIPDKKIEKKLPLFSCFTAPCKSGCPIGQDVPEYVALVGAGKHVEALKVITEKNPLPFITGTICSHRCMDKCMRDHYEQSVRIRNAKLEAAKNGFDALLDTCKAPANNGKKVAVVGGGPAGLAAAYFLARRGTSVTVYEKENTLGGVVRNVIPTFRISDDAIDNDIALVKKLGTQFVLGKLAPSVDELFASGYDDVLLAVGAWAPGVLKLETGAAMNVLDFLVAYKKGALGDIGKSVCVVGGGNTAMDAARAASRIPGVEKVSIVYRRTKRYMPADEEELALAMKDGVAFCDLLSPVRFERGTLVCRKMVLGTPDESGRRAPVETNELVTLPCDTLIAAVGEKVDTAFFASCDVNCSARGKVEAKADTLETSRAHVYVLGDANRGPATVVEAIADARCVADAILGTYKETKIPEMAYPVPADCRRRLGDLLEYSNASLEADRCLSCNTSCEACAQVCPNRANIAISVPGLAMRQIVHVDRMCNECGNCAVFCPYPDAPYRDKPTLFHTEQDFAHSENEGFLHVEGNLFKVRVDGAVRQIDASAPGEREWGALLGTILSDYAYIL